MDRAYSLLHVKDFNAATRVIRGTATTPTLDRSGDVLDPLGASFTNPIPLLLFHDRERPIGRVTLSTPTKDGIQFEATIPTINEPGKLRDRVDEAWQSIVAGLISGLSVGYRVLKGGAERIASSGGLLLRRVEICELSLVTIPANVDATILAIKALATSGANPLAVASPIVVVRADGTAPAMKETTAEQIARWETERATVGASMVAIMETANEGKATLDERGQKDYDALQAKHAEIDGHLTRLRALEKVQASSAAPIVPAAPAAHHVQVVNPEKGTGFARVAMAILATKGLGGDAVRYAERWKDSTPEVELFLKAAVAAGTTSDATWASPLVPAVRAIADEFIALLRPATILGRIPNLRKVPFNTTVPVQTAGGAYGWVGEAKPKPVTKLGFGVTKLDIAKAAGIIVLTEELVRTSNPSAEKVCRDDMIAGISAFLDLQFIDPAVAAVAGVNPASITNGLVAVASTGRPLEDVQLLLGKLSAANIPLAGVTLIVSETNALALGFSRTAQGVKTFPNVGVNGGTIEGIAVITSNAAAHNMIALQGSTVLYADEGGVAIDVSREASLQMDSAPMSPADATTVFVSLWQNNLVGLRAERFINWKRGIDTAVAIMTGVDYTVVVNP